MEPPGAANHLKERRRKSVLDAHWEPAPHGELWVTGQSICRKAQPVGCSGGRQTEQTGGMQTGMAGGAGRKLEGGWGQEGRGKAGGWGREWRGWWGVGWCGKCNQGRAGQSLQAGNQVSAEVLGEAGAFTAAAAQPPPRANSTYQLPAKALGINAAHVWRAGHHRKEITQALLHTGVLTRWKKRFYLLLCAAGTAGGGYAAGFTSTLEVWAGG